jgi:hypothetical protein
MLLYALVISVARAQELAVPGCAGCVVGCVTEVRGLSTLTTLQVVCATSAAACAICIASSTSIAFSRASSSAAGSNVQVGCSAQLPFAATILDECTAGSISVPTATASGTRPSADTPSGVSPPTGLRIFELC